MLGLTADNATNMDKMSKYIDRMVTAYSTANRTRCFNHILNLTSKVLLKQFDVKKRGGDGDDDAISAEEEKLLALAEGMEEEELAMTQETGTENEDDGGDALIDEDLDEIEEWIDEVSSEMSKKERQILAENIRPVSHVLVKVLL